MCWCLEHKKRDFVVFEIIDGENCIGHKVTVREDCYYSNSQDEHNQSLQLDSALIVKIAMSLRSILWQF